MRCRAMHAATDAAHSVAQPAALLLLICSSPVAPPSLDPSRAVALLVDRRVLQVRCLARCALHLMLPTTAADCVLPSATCRLLYRFAAPMSGETSIPLAAHRPASTSSVSDASLAGCGSSPTTPHY